MDGLKEFHTLYQALFRSVAISLPEMDGLKVRVYRGSSAIRAVAISLPEMDGLKESKSA